MNHHAVTWVAVRFLEAYLYRVYVRTGCAHGYSHVHKDFPRFCLAQNENILCLKVVTTPTQPQHNLNLTQLSWV